MRRYVGSVLIWLCLVFSSSAAEGPIAVQNDLGTNGALYVSSPPSPYTNGVLLLADPATPDVSLRLGTALSSSVFGVYDSANRPHLRVLGDGRVLVGADAVANAAYHFQLKSSTNNAAALMAWANTTYDATGAAQNDIGAWLLAQQNVALGATNSGSANGARMRGWLSGPGTLATTYGAYIQSGVSSVAASTAIVSTAYGVLVEVARNAGTIGTGYGVYLKDVTATTGRGLWQMGGDDVNYFAGKVGIGTQSPTVALEVDGDLKVSGEISGLTVIGAVYQDLAEWVPATEDLAPGTVVVLNKEKTNEVMASHGAYDTSVAGVVSAQPGVILGVGGEGKEQVATTGRVKVRVDARRGAIRVGDLLVTSPVEGTAMKSAPMQIDGRHFHQPGTIIGKALEPLEGGMGEILVLLSLQ